MYAVLQVFVDKGTPDGHKITMHGKADEAPGAEPGDVVVVVRQQEHSQFLRKEADLYMQVELSLAQALTGFRIVVSHLDGRKLLVRNKTGEDCWCNDACQAHGDCCSDFAVECGGEKPAECEKCGSYTCDEWIEWGAGKYTCESLGRDWGCKCAGCKCGGGSAQTTLSLLSEDKYPEARCLDGSMAGYYIRPGQEKDKFLLHLEGGGWCYDQNCKAPSADGTLMDCRKRSGGHLGSSKRWAQTKSADFLSGYLSADPKVNPVFSTWTLVYVPYCDGASFTGNSVVDDLHFKGEQILKAVLTELESKEGILEASRVVVSGGSAGASAVYFHADYIAKRLKEGGKQMEVLALPDAGFFLDVPDHQGVRCWPNQMISLFNVSGGYSSLHAGCLEKYTSEPWRCLFPEYFVDLIQTRLFIVNSLYDSSEITYSLGLDCCPGSCPYWKRPCTPAEMQQYDSLRSGHLTGWKARSRRVKGGGGGGGIYIQALSKVRYFGRSALSMQLTAACAAGSRTDSLRPCKEDLNPSVRHTLNPRTLKGLIPLCFPMPK
ncbi:PAE5 [Symbiodinium natans]|uniref:PAE5 protein n=1 Tax=Symbiodinium natans TaxID=878477 RepID=A0A812HVA2_9DINO|nr:PAE5 [Symbiodinium natans]